MLTVYVVLIGLGVSYKKILLDMLLPLHFYVHRLLPLTYWSKNSIFLKHDCLSFSSDNLSCKVWCFSFFVNREDRRYQISCKGYRRVVHYHWETKVIQRFMARDEIVVLHVTHTDRDRVVMKQRPSWLHCVSLKTKISRHSFGSKLMCYRELRSLVHPSERLLADGWHSEQRAPNPL